MDNDNIERLTEEARHEHDLLETFLNEIGARDFDDIRAMKARLDLMNSSHESNLCIEREYNKALDLLFAKNEVRNQSLSERIQLILETTHGQSRTIERLTKERDNLKANVGPVNEELRYDNELLRERLVKLELIVADADRIIERCQSEMATISDERDELRIQLNIQDDTISELKSRLDEANRVINVDLRQRIEEMSATATREITELRSKLASAMTSAPTMGFHPVLAGPPSSPTRHCLLDERDGITHKFEIAGETGYITVGLYPNGSPGEIFLAWAKAGSRVSRLLDAWATMVSIALQSGIDLETIVSKFEHWKFEPAGVTSNPEIRICESPLDYICRWLRLKFLAPLDNGDEV